MAALTATLAIAATAIGTGVQVFGQRQAADAAEDAAEYNAEIARNEATRVEQENHETIKRQRADKRRQIAQARSRLAANGAALGEGTSVDVLEVLDNRLETSVQDTARSAQLETRAIRQQANLAEFQGQQQAATLRTQSFGTLLSGASTAATQFRTFSDK